MPKIQKPRKTTPRKATSKTKRESTEAAASDDLRLEQSDRAFIKSLLDKAELTQIDPFADVIEGTKTFEAFFRFTEWLDRLWTTGSTKPRNKHISDALPEETHDLQPALKGLIARFVEVRINSGQAEDEICVEYDTRRSVAIVHAPEIEGETTEQRLARKERLTRYYWQSIPSAQYSTIREIIYTWPEETKSKLQSLFLPANYNDFSIKSFQKKRPSRGGRNPKVKRVN